MISHPFKENDGYAGRVYQIQANYKEKRCDLFWFRVGKDGSIYIGPSKTKNDSRSRQYKSLSVNHTQGTPTHVNLADIPWKTENFEKNSMKFSFHASGKIHSSDQSLRGLRIRDIQEYFELCYIGFERPQNLKQDTAKKGKIHVQCNFEILDKLTTQAKVVVCPLKKLAPPEQDLTSDFCTEVFHFRNLDNECPDISIQVILRTAGASPYPEHTLMLFRHF